MAVVKESLRQVKRANSSNCRAYQQAGYDPSTVELVEAHGTSPKSVMQQNYPPYLLCGLVYLAETMSLLVQ